VDTAAPKYIMIPIVTAHAFTTPRIIRIFVFFFISNEIHVEKLFASTICFVVVFYVIFTFFAVRIYFEKRGSHAQSPYILMHVIIFRRVLLYNFYETIIV